MTNLDKAAQVILDAQMNGLVKPRDLVDELKEAGLLMPDLPVEDYGARDEHHWLWAKNGQVGVILNDGIDSEPVVFTPSEARELALMLLAAADYAEKGTRQ